MTCDQLRQIKIPALMTYGGDTRSFFRIATKGAADCIPGAQLVAKDGGRHLAIIQQSEAFNAADCLWERHDELMAYSWMVLFIPPPSHSSES